MATTMVAPPAPLPLALNVSVLVGRKTLFYGAKWQTHRAELAHELLEFSPKLQVVLHFDNTRYVVVRGSASDDDASRSAAKHKLLLDVRSMDDARKAWVYQTAAKTERMELYVDTATLREQVLAFVGFEFPSQLPVAVLPVSDDYENDYEYDYEHSSADDAVPFAVPVRVSVSVPAPVPTHPSRRSDSEASVDLAQLIDASFDALAAAQAALERRPHDDPQRVPTALELYRRAERGFATAETHVPDARTRELFCAQRAELQRVIESLESSAQAEASRTEAAAVAQFPDPPASETSLLAASADSSATRPDVADAYEVAAALDERLARLARFAADRDVRRAQREHEPSTDDLRLRLDALHTDARDTASASSNANLEMRLQRLRGLGDAGDTRTDVAVTTQSHVSAIDRIIAQAQDELALGIDTSELEIEDGEMATHGTEDALLSCRWRALSPSPLSRQQAVVVLHSRARARLASTMNKVMDLESGHVVAVLEETVAALELVAVLPDASATERESAAFVDTLRVLSPAASRTLERHRSVEAAVLASTTLTRKSALEDRPEVDEGDWTSEHLAAFPKSLHCVLQLLTHDKATRDALRLASATTVSPHFAHFVLAWTQLVMHVERVCGTSTEQDERAAANVRESKLRLREAEDDRQQLAFELAAERDARVAMHERFAKTIAALQEQLKETQQSAAAALVATERGREQDLHTALSAFENQQTAANERALAVARPETRASDEHKQFEADERKRKQRVGADFHELLARYDCELFALDEAIAAEKRELARIELATASLVSYFARIDEDRSNQLDELRAIENEERRRRQRELNLFRFIQKLQACVRGFLVRRRYRLQLQAQKKKKKRKGSKKKTKATARTGTSAGGRSGGTGGKKAPKATTSTSASASGTKQPTPPESTPTAAAGARRASARPKTARESTSASPLKPSKS